MIGIPWGARRTTRSEVTGSTVTGNNYTGQGNASSTGIVVFGG
ncbi:MAG TPA: hypothetical protein VME19_10875 [Streptosporangiaceae bacterium]|nr:hypothetical protein [Streptosporangiaceae bacterium]